MKYPVELPYALLDVFTNSPFSGNQLAVFLEAGIERETMQKIARELNLSETVFVERASDAAASLRIFTPFHEMRFAGHPTIGAALLVADEPGWVDAGSNGFELDLPIGRVPIALERSTTTTAWLTTPPVRFGPTFGPAEAAAMVGLSAGDVCDDLPAGFAGADVPFLYIPLASESAVDRAAVVADEVRARAGWDDVNGVYVYALSGGGVYSRMFAPMSGIAEDPATGSAAGPLFALLDRDGRLPAGERFLVRQGVAMGRASELHVRLGPGAGGIRTYEVGGSAVRAGHGALYVR
jgi:trans-2,3-dihydro-3-hydroxyanthranilate isomerase